MYFLIYLNFLLFSAGQLTSLSRSGGGLNIYLFDLFLIFSNFVLFFWIGMRGKFKINFPLIVFIFFSTFAFLITFSQIFYFPFLEQIKVYSYLIRFISYFLFGYLIYVSLLSNLLVLGSLKKILIGNFYFLTFLNVLQLVFLNNLSELAVFGWDPHIGRLTGAFLDPNFMAFYLSLYFLINHFFLQNRYIEYLSILSIFLTLSRNGMLTFLIIFLLLNLKNIYKLFVLVLLLSILLLINPRIVERFSQFSDSNDSSYVRLISWNEAVRTFSMSGLMGLGFNNYRSNIEFYRVVSLESLDKNSSTATDSSLLHILVTLGPLGLIFSIILLLSFTYQKGMIMMNSLAVVSLLFNSLFINSYFFPPTSFLFFVILFLGLYLKESKI